MRDLIVNAALSHKRTVLLAMITILIFGVVARLSIPVESEPRIEVPFFVITVVHEGISPEDATRLLVMPLEIELKTVEGVKEVTGTGAEHVAIVTVEFEASADLHKALIDVREATNRAKQEFPSTAEEPVVQESATTDYPIIQVNLSSEKIHERSLYAAARRLRDRIESLPSVRFATMQGQRDEQLEILVEPSKLEAHGISTEQLYGALVRNNRLIAAGSIRSGRGSFSVKIPSVIEEANDLFDLPITVSNNTVITLSDVASIKRTFKDRTSYSHSNGSSSVSIFVYKRAQANTIETATHVKEISEPYRSELPNSVEMSFSHDHSEFASKQITELEGNILTSLVLVMVVVIGAMGLRDSLIVGAAIPVSFLFALIVLWLAGQSFNFMVMFGMLLGLGMLIDGAIVVTEYADRRMVLGDNAHSAYATAAKRMFWPVTASVTTTLAAFLPLLFWPGVPGKFMGFLPKALFAVLAGSLLYALIFGPLLGAMLGQGSRKQATEAPPDLAAVEKTDLSKLGFFSNAFAKLLRLTTQYAFITTVLVILLVFGVFTWHGSKNLGMLFFNENDPTVIQVFVRARGNLSPDEAHELVSEVESSLLSIEGIQYINTFASRETGLAEGQRLSLQGGGLGSDTIGSMFIELHDGSERTRSGSEIVQDMRAAVAQFNGVIVEVRPLAGGPTAGKPIQIQFSSEDKTILEPVVRRVVTYMHTGIDGLIDIDDSLPASGFDWQLQVDREKAALYGVDVSVVGTVVQLVTNGLKLGEYRPDDADDALDIRIRFPEENRGIEALDRLRVATAQGMVPIANFVTKHPAPSVDTIQRRDQKTIQLIRADVGPGYLADAKVREIQTWLASQQFDPRIAIAFRGANEDQQESIDFVSKAFSAALILMFGLLVTQFNSIYQSLLILLAVVLSTAGVFLGLALTNQPFSAILSGVGVVALAGIVVNNNIVLIDSYNSIRKAEPDLDYLSIIVRTGAQRFRPVMLTTFTTVVGLLPLATHQSIDFINRSWVSGGQLSGYWVPLAQAIVFGLSFATILTLIATPALLALPHQWKNVTAPVGAFAKRVLTRSRPTSQDTIN